MNMNFRCGKCKSMLRTVNGGMLIEAKDGIKLTIFCAGGTKPLMVGDKSYDNRWYIFGSFAFRE
ncbi:MAG: hypothetical protein KatS3mg029_0748 [Saprospiraceae bacterium]|nr:MAG: hypothetical protein KatS3mg029_0748 [Saprospiraceae bacterium]